MKIGTRERNWLTATLIFATRSASELPIAKMVTPMIASESPKIKPNVCELFQSWLYTMRKASHTCRTSTTSSAIAMIQTTATIKPMVQRANRLLVLSPLPPKTATRMPIAAPVTPAASKSHGSRLFPSANINEHRTSLADVILRLTE